jgi:hypothetical protein
MFGKQNRLLAKRRVFNGFRGSAGPFLLRIGELSVFMFCAKQSICAQIAPWRAAIYWCNIFV